MVEYPSSLLAGLSLLLSPAVMAALRMDRTNPGAIGTGSDVVSTTICSDAEDTSVSVKVDAHDSILTKQVGTFSPVNLAKHEPSAILEVISSG
jgi:hypothetical protein